MEKNWIKEITEFVRRAENKGLEVGAYSYDGITEIRVITENTKVFSFVFNGGNLSIRSKKGHVEIPYTLTKRDSLELESLCLSIQEYSEDMAILEFEEFMRENDSDSSGNKPINIDDLEDD